MRTLTAIAGLLAALWLASCGTNVPPAPATAPNPTPGFSAPISPLRDARAPAALVTVHDTGHVTGTYPATCRATADNRPDPTCTPGAIRDDITDANTATTICRSGWTATVRAPESETSKAKRAAMQAYGITAPATNVEEDHFVPLELGGANSTTNLWSEVSDEPGQGFRNHKDGVENDLHRAVCAHRVALGAAQQAIATNWHTAEQKLGIGR